MEALRKCSLMTAIKTPYLEDGKFDLKAYDALVELQIQNGVEALIIGGTTGEGHLMSWDEHIMLIAHSVYKFGSRLLVVGNTGSNNTAEALHATEQGFAVGMHCALQINPYYGKTSNAGMLAHFNRCLALGPAIIYNVPGRTGQDIPPSVVEEIAKHENFVGMKECMGNERISYYTSRGIPCWSGNDDQAFEAKHRCGASGVISVTSNVVPGLMRRLMDEDDSKLNEQLGPVMDWMFCEPNPIALNTVLAMSGVIKPVFRLPYVPLSEDQQRVGVEVLGALPSEALVYGKPEVMPVEKFTLIGGKYP
jgi:4-hydroxy-tetrahydrodipicolinate synthase